MAIAPPQAVTGAVKTPLQFGLFSTFSFRPADRWEQGVTWETGTCEPVDGIGSWACDPEDDTLGLPKNLTGGPGVGGAASEFTVYGHFTCSPVGWSPAAAQAQADAHLLLREEARVEQAFWTGDLGNTPSLRGATVVGTTAVSLQLGLAVLEQYVAEEYGGQGLIHMTRAAASLLADGSLTSNGGRLSTKLGTPVAAGAGYDGSGPAGEAATATTEYLYVTPPVFGYRTDPFTSSNNPGDLLDRATNDLYAVTERTYLLGFDPCGVAATLITLG